jgi:hypothetical protein
MKVSHILFKVDDLEKSVEKFRDKGFNVEYGSKRHPHNALIYFSEGPYIELINKVSVSALAKNFLRLLGKGKVIERIENWENRKEGFFEICLENYSTNFEEEEGILKKHEKSYFITKSKRTDPANRALKWRMLFPFDLNLPFFMTYFNIDPKPKDFIHPNGTVKIKSITYGTQTYLIPIIKELCDDEILELFEGEGVKDVTYETGN